MIRYLNEILYLYDKINVIMDIKYVSQYLNDYINMDNPQYAVMLKGKWGCGKTYYINELIKIWNTEIKESQDKISLRPVYVSLNGISSVSQVSFMIRRELRPFLYSKGMMVAKKVFCGTIKAVTKGAFDLDNDGNKDDLSDIFDAESIIEILSKSNDSVEGKKIIVFDDLERCKIPTDEMFGYINNLVEHSNCKVIIIGEEDKIKAKYENVESLIGYKDFKEKLIGQTFSINQNFEDIINQFVANSHNKYLVDNKDLVVELFIASEVENLRIIKQFFSDFKRLVESMTPSDFKKELFDDFIKNAIAYFVITYCEHKSGNKDINYFQSISYFNTDEEKGKVRFFEGRYNHILNRYSLKHSMYTFKVESIIDFIDNGFIPDLQALLNSNEILNVRTIADWEQVWYYWNLDNRTFNRKLKTVKDLFYRGDMEFVTITLHICGMFLKFNRVNIAKFNEQYVVKTAKRHIDNIYKNATGKPKDKLVAGLYSGSWGKQYMEHDSPEMKELIKYAESKLSKYFESERQLYCKNFWQYIKDEDSDRIYTIFNESIPSGYSSYNLSSVFDGVDEKKTALRFTELSNQSKYNIAGYLSGRYYLPESRISGAISDYHIKDLPSLKSIKNILEIKTKRLKQIDKIATSELIKTLGLCIDKLKSVSLS